MIGVSVQNLKFKLDEGIPVIVLEEAGFKCLGGDVTKEVMLAMWHTGLAGPKGQIVIFFNNLFQVVRAL